MRIVVVFIGVMIILERMRSHRLRCMSFALLIPLAIEMHHCEMLEFFRILIVIMIT